MAYIVKIFRLVRFGKLRPSLIGSTLIDASGIENTIVLAVLGIVTFFFTVVAFRRWFFRAVSGRMSDLFAYATFASEDARLGAFSFGVAIEG